MSYQNFCPIDLLSNSLTGYYVNTGKCNMSSRKEKRILRLDAHLAEVTNMIRFGEYEV